MNGRYLLDTNIVIALLASDRKVAAGLENAGAVFLSSISLGELYYGARKSARPDDNTQRLNQLASSMVILGCDTETARRYGSVKDNLRRRGRPIPENDVWIAAIALQHGLTLSTRDAHFDAVAGLAIEVW
jgi:tRNA(fMet)-specific endonuclease VapC